MISKSTKTKRRHNREFLKKVQNIKVRCIDKRIDFWLISYPVTESKALHTEVRGRQFMMKVYRNTLKRFLYFYRPSALGNKLQPKVYTPLYKES